MKSLLILGAGSFSTEVEELARQLGYNDIAFLDDSPDTARCQPVIGKLDETSAFIQQFSSAIVALGNNEMRMKYTKMLLDAGYDVPVLIHPTAYVSKDAALSCGCIVRAKAVISRYVKLGTAVIINAGVIVDHDCTIGEGVHCLPGAVVRNKVTVPPMRWIRANEVVE